jgi:hypothetical protein
LLETRSVTVLSSDLGTGSSPGWVLHLGSELGSELGSGLGLGLGLDMGLGLGFSLDLKLERKCRARGITNEAWFSLPIKDSSSFLVTTRFDLFNISEISSVQAVNLSKGSCRRRRRVLIRHPKTIWDSAGAPSASSLSLESVSLLGTGSCSFPALGLIATWIARGPAEECLSICSALSIMTMMMSSMKQSLLPRAVIVLKLTQDQLVK